MTDVLPDDNSSREYDPEEVIGWLNEHLALYAEENRDLRNQIAEKDRKIERLLKYCQDFRRQKEEA